MYISRKKKEARATLFKPSFRRKRGISRLPESIVDCLRPIPSRDQRWELFLRRRDIICTADRKWITRFVSTLHCSGTCENEHTDLSRHLGTDSSSYSRRHTLGTECLIRSFVFITGEKCIFDINMRLDSVLVLNAHTETY